MRISRWLLVASLVATLPAAAPGDPAAPADERTVQAAGLTADGPTLVSFFRTRGKADADGEHLRALVRQLGDESAAVRDRAAAELVAWGPLAVPVLRQAANDLEEDAVARARRCLLAIEGPDCAALPAAAARLVAALKPNGAAEALLAYLPFADNQAVLREVRAALSALAYSDGKPDAALLRALKDPVAVRRAAAGAALYRPDQPAQWQAVRELLRDPKPAVRLRATLSLSAAGDPEAITVLIDLLADLPPEQRKQAEEILRELAGEWAPGAVTGEDEIVRRIRRDTWAAWWKNADGPALLAMLRKHTLSPEGQARARDLIKKLGDESFEVRTQAAAELVSMGRQALPYVRDAARDGDLEIARRATECAARIEQDRGPVLTAVALRMLAVRRPEGAAEALLAYLPHAEGETLSAEAQRALDLLATRDGKAEPAVLQALEDRLPLRRAAAAAALARVGGEGQRPAVRKLLKDPDAEVRLRVALALTGAHDREAVPTLIDLLAELPPKQVWQAQEVLYVLAGDSPPEKPGNSDEERKRNRDAWAAWWKANGDKADFARLDPDRRWLNLTLVVDHAQGRVYELGPDKKPRWTINGLQNPIDAVVLPGNRVLIAEYSGLKVTERDFTGKVLWEKNGLPANPTNVQRLPNGNTFIATQNCLFEVDRAGREVVAIRNLNFLSACKAADGTIWALTANNQLLHLDATGKELKNIQLSEAPGTTGLGLDVLPNGGVLLPLFGSNRVLEIDAEGKTVFEVGAPQAVAATRLPNGHVLVASHTTQRVYEIDRKGQVVWEHQDPGSQPFRARRR